jgi:hypothetical protein
MAELTVEPPRQLARREVPARRRWAARSAVGAIAAALVVLGAAAFAVVGTEEPALAEAPMMTPNGRNVGDAYINHDGTSWLFVSVPEWLDAGDGTSPLQYRIRLTLDDGSEVSLETGPIEMGAGGWGAVLPTDPDRVREVAMIGPNGNVWCSATF